jgi:hypothetical protein
VPSLNFAINPAVFFNNALSVANALLSRSEIGCCNCDKASGSKPQEEGTVNNSYHRAFGFSIEASTRV